MRVTNTLSTKRSSVKRICLAALLLTACATTPARAPDPPRIRCLALGHVPESAYFVYLCTFTGDSVPSELPEEVRDLTSAGAS